MRTATLSRPLLPALLWLASCAQTLVAAPAAPSATTHDFGRLKGRVAAIGILDRRPRQDDSEETVARVHADVADALTREGVRIDDAAASPDARVDVRINALDANFELGNWVGCTRLSYELHLAQAIVPGTAPVERCVKKSNMWGNGSAHDVIDDSYAGALAELLSGLEVAISHAGTASAAPAPLSVAPAAAAASSAPAADAPSAPTAPGGAMSP